MGRVSEAQLQESENLSRIIQRFSGHKVKWSRDTEPEEL